MLGDVLLGKGFRLCKRLGVALAVDGVGLDEVLLMRRCRVDAFVDGRDRARRHAGTAVDALLGMDIHQGRGGILGLILPRVDAVDGAHVHAGGVLGLDTRVSDDEGHARESPS
jgi:hypothetical protein